MKNPYLESLRPFFDKLDLVKVKKEKLDQLIGKMKKEDLKIPAWDLPVFPKMNCSLEEWINFICWLNSINFCFTNFEYPWRKFTIEWQGELFEGATALAASLSRAKEEKISIFDPEFMARLSFKDLNYILRPKDWFLYKIPLIQERQKILNQNAKILIEKYQGSWKFLFEQGGFLAFNKGQGIVERLVSDFPSFKDQRLYRGQILQFQKRAQLLVMMYYGRAVHSNFPKIKDINDIGPIANYDVPKALRFFEVLEYDPKLDEIILNHRLVWPQDPKEVEIRVAMSQVMAEICQRLKINMAQADFYIWKMGKDLNLPHLLVPTKDY